jgi:hypothetical protein
MKAWAKTTITELNRTQIFFIFKLKSNNKMKPLPSNSLNHFPAYFLGQLYDGPKGPKPPKPKK